ncbi:MAG: hypothetical protein ABSH08_01190 [Tepidisphaeraceae bacterium]|jgi:hypothetical protein
MTLANSTELLNTQAKLRELEMRYEELRLDLSEDPRVRRLTMLSLKRLINQLTEEVARFEARLRHA